jgi:hypothetical protein
MTNAGRIPESANYLDFSTKTKGLWEAAPASFASDASGTISVFNGDKVSFASVCRDIEYPILVSNGVKIIFHGWAK